MNSDLIDAIKEEEDFLTYSLDQHNRGAVVGHILTEEKPDLTGLEEHFSVKASNSHLHDSDGIGHLSTGRTLRPRKRASAGEKLDLKRKSEITARPLRSKTRIRVKTQSHSLSSNAKVDCNRIERTPSPVSKRPLKPPNIKAAWAASKGLPVPHNYSKKKSRGIKKKLFGDYNNNNNSMQLTELREEAVNHLMKTGNVEKNLFLEEWVANVSKDFEENIAMSKKAENFFDKNEFEKVVDTTSSVFLTPVSTAEGATDAEGSNSTVGKTLKLGNSSQSHGKVKAKLKSVLQEKLEQVNSERLKKDTDDLEIYDCDHCEKWFESKKQWRNHQQVHQNPQSFTCDTCKKSFNRRSTLVKHVLVHTGERPFECEHCGQRFSWNSHWRRHLRKHSSPSSMRCGWCDKLFLQNWQLKEHELSHAGEKQYSCDVCHRRFGRQERLDEHIPTHSMTKSHMCHVCGAGFQQASNLKKHMRIHSDERPFPCSVCDKKFRTKETCHAHQRTHSGEQPYCCDICSKRFAQRCSLARHRMIHTGLKPYSCQICKMDFNQRSTLNRHMMIHSDSKPFKCPHCDLGYIQRGSLQYHIMRVHQDIKPFKCTQCDMSFVQKCALKGHQRTHSGDRPFECDLCGSTFAQKSSLKTHIIRLHAIDQDVDEKLPDDVPKSCSDSGLEDLC